MSGSNGNGTHPPPDELNEIWQMLDRISKLSSETYNPGHAYRNLEMINTLSNSLTLRLERFFAKQNARKS